MNPFLGPQSKINRALIHIKTLNDTVSGWRDSDPLPIVAKHFNSDKTAYIYRFQPKAVPIDIGAIAGDAVHNMRSALDGIAWQYAFRIPPTQRSKGWEKDVQFPIFLSIDDAKSERKFKRMLKHFPDDVRDFVDSIQPYQAPKSEREHHPLWCLERLSIVDKHRAIPTFAAITAIAMQPGWQQERFDNGAVEVTIPVVEENFIPHAPQLRPFLYFGANEVIAYPFPVQDFSKIYDFIHDVVLPTLVGIFSQLKE